MLCSVYRGGHVPFISFVNAAEVSSNVVANECNVTLLRRIDDVKLAGNASGSGSLRNVSLETGA
jgi:hypothetical protein